MRQKIKRTKGERIIFSIVFVILAIYVTFILYHFYLLLQLATKGSAVEYDQAVLTDTLGTWSKNFTLKNFIYAFDAFTDDYGNTFLGMTFNSVWFAIGSQTIFLFLQSSATYVVCKYKFKGRMLIYNLILLRMLIPIVGTLPATYRAYDMLGILNSPLILVTATDVLGGSGFLIFYSFYKAISWEYAESAFIDGANHFDVYLKIMFPMTLPSISVLFISGFIGHWNEYMNISLFLPELPTLSYGLYMYEQNMQYAGGNMPAYFAGVFIAAIPPITLFIIFQNSIMQKIHMGGLKG
ncbi:MAG: carbohydrate ABC transporter permease [Clostridia bacterium]|nr:carbohydrate ABC transporter permease [Clostridia bacterium]